MEIYFSFPNTKNNYSKQSVTVVLHPGALMSDQQRAKVKRTMRRNDTSALGAHHPSLMSLMGCPDFFFSSLILHFLLLKYSTCSLEQEKRVWSRTGRQMNTRLLPMWSRYYHQAALKTLIWFYPTYKLNLSQRCRDFPHLEIFYGMLIMKLNVSVK